MVLISLVLPYTVQPPPERPSYLMFQSFHHSCYDGRRLLWNMTELSAIHGFTYVVENKNDLNLVQEVVASYEKHVIPRYQHFTKGRAMIFSCNTSDSN